LILLVIVGFTLVKRKFNNRYTLFAFFEFTIALILRTISCFLFDELIFQLPFYLLMQVAFAMLFGWFTLRDVLQGILLGENEGLQDIKRTQTNHLRIFVGVTLTVYLMLAY
jgi:hypothetical protein